MRIGRDVELPLIGSIAYGLIDRGSNVIQVRPLSYCVLNCIMCSTDAGPCSKWRIAEYIVDKDLIVEWFKSIIKYKGEVDIEAHIDTVGDPLLYPKLEDLIQELKDAGASRVSLQTHGPTLTVDFAEKLSSSGLDRINLSIDSVDLELAKKIQGVKWYNVKRVLEVVEYILENTETDVHVAPVHLPGINTGEIPKIIEWGLKVGVGKRYPPFGIQKFLKHKRGRKPRGMKVESWREFYRFLDSLSRKYNINLKPTMEDFKMKRARMLPQIFKVGDKVRVKVLALGWMRGEVLGVPVGREDVAITLVDSPVETIGATVSARIISNKHNIYLAKPKL